VSVSNRVDLDISRNGQGILIKFGLPCNPGVGK
jgi:hypothetical protein